MKILIVDDDLELLSDLSGKLKSKNHDVFVTDNCVEIFRTISEKKIDLLISNVMLPCLSGYTLISTLKSYFINIPVIFISSHLQESVTLDSHQIKADDFFSKPIDFKKLLQRVDEYAEYTINLN
jgi:DNA-binding response OmpR family regulator